MAPMPQKFMAGTPGGADRGGVPPHSSQNSNCRGNHGTTSTSPTNMSQPAAPGPPHAAPVFTAFSASGWLNLFLPIYVLTAFETLTIINKADTGCSEDNPGEMSVL